MCNKFRRPILDKHYSKHTFHGMLHRLIYSDIYTVWQKKRYNQNQSCFIQAVISSNYVEINQQKLLAVTCFEAISKELA